jgi:hypothetical protein
MNSVCGMFDGNSLTTVVKESVKGDLSVDDSGFCVGVRYTGFGRHSHA